MPDFSYNPGISYRGDAYTYQGLDALGQGIGSFLQNQHKARRGGSGESGPGR